MGSLKTFQKVTKQLLLHYYHILKLTMILHLVMDTHVDRGTTSVSKGPDHCVRVLGIDHSGGIYIDIYLIPM